MPAGAVAREPLPSMIQPMLATAGKLPRSDEGWAYEMKWDGVRAVVFVEAGRVRLMSRNSRDVSVSYPELANLGGQLGPLDAALDGEIVALDAAGRPSFSALQQRMHISDAGRAAKLAAQQPVTLLLFDALHLDGRSTLRLAYSDRRRVLESLELAGPHWRTPGSFTGGGAAVAQASREQGLEGVVAKRLTSVYQPGRRSEAWRKVKVFSTQEVVVVGYTTGQGWRGGSFGALLLAVPDAAGAGGLRYVGRVGSGFTEEVLADLGARFAALARIENPFSGTVPAAETAGAVFVEPRLVAEIRYGEWTPDGRLRHPSWRGLRPDKVPADVVVERPAPR